MKNDPNVYLSNKDILLLMAACHNLKALTPAERETMDKISKLGTRQGAFL